VAVFLAPNSFRVRSTGLLVAGFSAILTFIATTPYALINSQAFLDGLTFDATHYFTGHSGHTVDSALVAMAGHLWADHGVGPPTLIVGGASLLVLLTARGRKAVGKPVAVLLSFVVAYGLLFASARVDFARSALLLIPALVLLTATSLRGILEIFSGPLRWVVALSTAALLGMTALPGITTWQALGLERTETQAHDWILANVPTGSSILIENFTPHLPQSRYAVLATFTISDVNPSRLDRFDYNIVSHQTFYRFANPDPDNSESVNRYNTYGAVFSRPPAAVFCPEPGRSTGAEVWIFPRSDRARALYEQPIFFGQCRLDWPWLPPPPSSDHAN
jgi:hypothetical protein